MQLSPDDGFVVVPTLVVVGLLMVVSLVCVYHYGYYEGKALVLERYESQVCTPKAKP